MKKYFKTKEDMQEFINEIVMYKSLIKEETFQAITTGAGVGPAKSDFPSLAGVKLKKVSMEGAGKVAADLLAQLKGKNEKNNAEEIVAAIHKPIYDAVRGDGAFEKTKDKYSKEKTLFQHYADNLTKTKFAWSGWFLNRCYLGTKAEANIIEHSKGFSHSGCCYPWYRCIENRRKIAENPSSFTGKNMLILATKSEIEAMGGFTDGDASVVGQGKAAPTVEWLGQQKKLGSGVVHMNVKAGDIWIGGNLSNEVKSSGDDTGEANAFMIMINVGGVNEEATSEIISKGELKFIGGEKSFKPVIGFKKYTITLKGEASTKTVAYWYRKDISGKEIVKVKDAKDPKKSVVDLEFGKKKQFLDKLALSKTKEVVKKSYEEI